MKSPGQVGLVGRLRPNRVAAIAELVLHGWDLAVATGQAYTVREEAAAAALAAVEANAELYRQYQGFADPVTLADGAPVLDRALALSGRDPRWTADAA